MGSVIGEVTPLALGVALSPFPVVPAVLLLSTPRAKATAGAFLAGWAAGILLRHIFYMSAQTAMMRPGPSRDYYLKKRAEGLLHTQALLALARRRVDVLWAMLRDKRLFTSVPPVT